MKRARLKKLEMLDGLVYPQVGQKLLELARDVPAALAIVELGSYRGRSTCYLAEGARLGAGATVYAVDPWELGIQNDHRTLNDPLNREVFTRQLRQMGFGAAVQPVQGFSVDVASTWTLPVGLLFLDAWHSLDAIRADVEAWTPHLVANAVIALDDYQNRRTPDVTRYVDTQMRTSPLWTGWDLDTYHVAVARRTS